jgi:hypothetical protein
LVEIGDSGVIRPNVSLDINLFNIELIGRWISQEPEKHLARCVIGQKLEGAAFEGFSNAPDIFFDYDIVQLQSAQRQKFYALAYSAKGPGFNNRLQTWAILDDEGNFIAVEIKPQPSNPGQYIYTNAPGIKIKEAVCINIGNPWVSFEIMTTEDFRPTKFPLPLPISEHPWNQERFGPIAGFKFSHLDRHDRQIDKFRTQVLPLLVKRHLNDCRLRFAVVGPATGEEIATILAAVIEEFEANSEWGRHRKRCGNCSRSHKPSE